MLTHPLARARARQNGNKSAILDRHGYSPDSRRAALRERTPGGNHPDHRTPCLWSLRQTSWPSSQVDGGREEGRDGARGSQEETQVQRGYTKTNGGSAAETLGLPKSQRSSGVSDDGRKEQFGIGGALLRVYACACN